MGNGSLNSDNNRIDHKEMKRRMDEELQKQNCLPADSDSTDSEPHKPTEAEVIE